MRDRAWALVLTAPHTLERRDMPLPDIGDDDGLLRVEAAGVCGTDVEQHAGRLLGVGAVMPVVPGHEIVGVVERLGAEAARRWRVGAGDRVVVEEVLRCGACDTCARPGRGCERLRVYGLTETVDTPPGLWGGFASHVYLAPTVRLHRVPEGVDAVSASLALPLANGLRWAGTLPGTRPGDTVAVLGPGQQGLGCVVGALEAGATTVVAVGLKRDAARLRAAAALGATHTLVAADGDAAMGGVVRDVRDLTAGRGAQVVVDATAGAPGAVQAALEMAAPGGTVVLAGLKGLAPVSVTTDLIPLRDLRVLGGGGHDDTSVHAALALLAGSRYPFSVLQTHRLPLGRAGDALRLAGRVGDGDDCIHVTLVAEG